MAGLQYVDQPNYSAIIFRRTFAELSKPGALMDRAREWLVGTDAKWNEQKAHWRFPSGAVLAFGYLKSSDDRYQYQSAEFDFIGFDELTHFPEEDYLYMFSRLRRRSDSLIPPRMRGATNPGGRGHKWVKERFVDAPATAERIFIRAGLDDNPYVDRESYLWALQQLDSQTRAQLLDGDWNARPPGDWVYEQAGIDAAIALGAALDRNQPSPAGGAIALGIDWGEQTHGLPIWPLERGGIYVPPVEVVASGEEPGRSAERMLAMAANLDAQLTVARYDAAGVQSMRTFAAVARRKLPGIKTTSIPFGSYKIETVGYLRLLFERAAEGKETQTIAISPRNEVLIDQLRGLQFNDVDAGKVEKGEDHGPDALIAGVAPVARRFRRRREDGRPG